MIQESAQICKECFEGGSQIPHQTLHNYIKDYRAENKRLLQLVERLEGVVGAARWITKECEETGGCGHVENLRDALSALPPKDQ